MEVNETYRKSGVGIGLHRKSRIAQSMGMSLTGPEYDRERMIRNESDVEIRHVSKRFGATVALKDLSLDLAAGNVYGILGENGSGKSTLVKILSGVLRPDHGSVRIGERVLTRHTPTEAIAAGVATAQQEVLVAKNLSVLDNLFIWERGWRRGTLSASERRQAATRVLRELCEVPPALDVAAGHVSLASQQAIVVARAVLQQAKIVILDEATSALDAYDAERVLKWARAHGESGGTVLFVSHRLGELMTVADRIIVFRDGAVAGQLRKQQFSRRAALELMSPERNALAEKRIRVARQVEGASTQTQESRPGTEIATLRAVNLALRPGAPAVNVAFESGTITGLAGLDGQGQTDLLRYLSGWARAASGYIELVNNAGSSHVVNSAQQAAKLGVAYVPRDRKSDGILPTRSVLENFGIANWGAASVGGVLQPRRVRTEYDKLVRNLSIKSSGPRAQITSLSGGSQQKVIVARWLARRPQVLLLDDPTRGVDLGTKSDLYQVLRQEADANRVVVVLVSTDVEELASLCDRILVFRQGRVTADLPGDGKEALAVDTIVAAMFRDEESADGRT